MAYRSVEIANEFLRQPDAPGRLTQMQLQKLVYLANGWNWAVNGAQLVADPVEAWDYGPVYPDLYDHTKFFGREPIGRPITVRDNDAARVFGLKPTQDMSYSAALDGREQAVIANVWQRYGRLSGAQLSALTHQRGTPWSEAYRTRGKSSVIDQAAIRAHYVELAGRAYGSAA